MIAGEFGLLDRVGLVAFWVAQFRLCGPALVGCVQVPCGLVSSLPTDEYGVRDRALVERAYAAARADHAQRPREKVGTRDWLAGGIDALAWFLGLKTNAPVSGRLLPVSILHIRNEGDLAESLIRRHLRNDRELTQNYLVGAQQALMWLNRETDEPPGYYEDDADT